MNSLLNGSAHLLRSRVETAPGKGSRRPRARGVLLVLAVAGFLVSAAAHAITVTSLTSNPTVPRPYGTLITWTATTTGGIAPVSYEFWRLDAGTWVLVQPYSTTNTYAWTPTLADVGSHQIAVWVKNNGSGATYDAYRLTAAFNITNTASITSIVAVPTLPRPPGTAITWTANATSLIGGTLQYRFWRNDNGAGWVMRQDYSTTKTYTWTPTNADLGTHDLAVWVKNSTSGAAYDAWKDTGNFQIVKPTTISALTANVTFPKTFGSAITFTATATSIPGPTEYQFWRNDIKTGLGWQIVRPYSATRTYSWTPTSGDLGLHDIIVWARNVGAAAPYEDWKNIGNFNIQGTATLPTIAVVPATTKPAGQPISFTATSTGNPGPLEYQFWRNDGAGYVLAQAWSPSNSYMWIPGTADQATAHDVAVWVRNQGSFSQYENWKNTGGFNIAAPQPLSVSNLQSYPPVPKPQGSILFFQPSTAGGMWPLQFQYWKYKYSTGSWSIVQPYSTNPVLNWTPTAAEVGDYQISVWVKNNGSNAQYDAYTLTNKFAITPPTSDIVRFLEQATFGPTDAEIERVRTMGMSAWIDDQFLQAPTGYPAFAPVTDNQPTNCPQFTCATLQYSMYPMQLKLFQNALYGNDQLRQRVAFALHSLVVTSGLDIPLPSWSQPYHAAIQNNTFGNYRQLLYDVSLTPAMGDYLNMDTNTLNNPNENFARELMQLFSVGTGVLNIDGTYQTLADGSIVPTYDQFIVTEFARALTGFHFQPQIGPGITNWRDPMIASTASHDLGSKTLLGGFTTAAGASPLQDFTDVIDNVFNHGNVGPYLARHLIRQMVTSNPSPGYIQRVATVFNNNGSGVRGDMKAVIKAVLLDAEARQPVPADPNFGHLKEPVLFMTHLLRAMNVKSANGLGVSDGYLTPQAQSMLQDPLRPPTVFSYYPADFQVPGGTIGAPEFGVYQTVTTLKRANFVNTMVFSTIPVNAPNAPNGTSIDLSVLTVLAQNPPALLKELDRILLHDTMSPQMNTSILNAVNAVSASNPKLRAQTALYLVATSSQYQVER